MHQSYFAHKKLLHNTLVDICKTNILSNSYYVLLILTHYTSIVLIQLYTVTSYYGRSFDDILLVDKQLCFSRVEGLHNCSWQLCYVLHQPLKRLARYNFACTKLQSCSSRVQTTMYNLTGERRKQVIDNINTLISSIADCFQNDLYESTGCNIRAYKM